VRPRARGEPQPVKRSARANDLRDSLRGDLGFANARDRGVHSGIDRPNTDFSGGAQQVELCPALDEAHLRGEIVGFEEPVPGEAGIELAAPPPYERLAAEKRNVRAGEP
jgi:hypothetical protein